MASTAGSIEEARGNWTIPEKELFRLVFPLAERCVREIKADHPLSSIDLELGPAIVESVARTMIARARLPGLATKIPSLFDLTLAELVHPPTLPPELFHWYVALRRLEMLPNKIPPLCLNCDQILNMRDFSLFLLPLCSVSQLEIQARNYGKALSSDLMEQNPFESFFSGTEAAVLREEFGNLGSNGPRWIWVSKRVLTESCNRPYLDQVRMIQQLGKERFGVNLEVPRLIDVIAFIFFRMVATGEIGFQPISVEIQRERIIHRERVRYTNVFEVAPSTYVQEVDIKNRRLKVASMRGKDSMLQILAETERPSPNLGIAPVAPLDPSS